LNKKKRLKKKELQHLQHQQKNKNQQKKTITKPFGKTDKRVVIRPREPRFYPADTLPKPSFHRVIRRPTKLKSSIKQGQVLILLAGRFRGKRVVFIKQLRSGLILVTGPYKINGVPLRRVNQAYVIATSTRVNIEGITVDPKFVDSYFRKAKKEKKKKTETEFFAPEKEQKKLDPARAADQKLFDAPLLAIIKKQEYLRDYLKAHFSLSKGQYPHQIKF